MTDGKLPMRVLVIEDDDTLAKLLLRVLQRDGCHITHARDGQEGLEAFTREQPHVVLSDGLLPKLTGFEVCKAIRAQAGDRVGIIMMSAAFRAVPMRSKEVQEARVDAFLSKPFVLGDLRKRVLELARRSIDVRRAAAGEVPIVHTERPMNCTRVVEGERAERRAAPKPARIPSGDRSMYSSNEGLA